MSTLGELLDNSGIQEGRLLGGCHLNDLRPVDTSTVDQLVVERDGWPLLLMKVCSDGSQQPIILGTLDDGTIEIFSARLESWGGRKRIILHCKLDDFELDLTVDQVRANAILDDDPGMVHPPMRRREGIASRMRHFLTGAH